MAKEQSKSADAADLSMTEMMAVIQEQKQALNALLAQQADDIVRRHKSAEVSAHIKAECEKSCQQRTQEHVNRVFDGPRRFKVSIPGDRIHVQPLSIPAHSVEEAQGRFNTVCGIRSTEHTHVVEAA